MAKFDNKNKKNNKGGGRPSYFDKQIQQYRTDDFLPFKDPRRLEQEANNIIMDLANGNIDFVKHGHYFYDANKMITVACLNRCVAKHMNYQVQASALQFYVQHGMSTGYVVPEQYNQRLGVNMFKMEAYATAIGFFQSILYSEDQSILFTIPSALRGYKNAFYPE